MNMLLSFLVVMSSAYTTFASCGARSNQWTGDCGALQDKTDCWMEVTVLGVTDDWCVADTKDQCCEINAGLLAGVIIGCVAACCCCVGVCVFVVRQRRN